MEHAIAEAEAEKLRDKDGVQNTEIKQNSKGVYIEVQPVDRTAMHTLRDELHNYNVWIEILEPTN